MRYITTQLVGQLATRINEVSEKLFGLTINDKILTDQEIVDRLEDLQDAALQLKLCLINEYGLKEPHFYDDRDIEGASDEQETGN